MSFSPPPYPYERLGAIKSAAALHDGGAIDCSIGTPVDPPPDFVVAELARATGARGYPPSAGTPVLRDAVLQWLDRRFGVSLTMDHVAACVGTKEFVASIAGFLHLRHPDRDTVLYPAISYPTYAMGATLAGLRAVRVPLENGRLVLEAIEKSDIDRALLLWSNSPSNPTGELDDLATVADWGRRHNVLAASDECYADFTWDGAPCSILEDGDEGVLAVHSISKRSNLAGVRAGFYAGDKDVVAYLQLLRQHAGLMVAAPVQSAVALAYGDDQHVEDQRAVYQQRLTFMAEALRHAGLECRDPQGSFYLWCRDGRRSGWELASWLAETAGLIVSPGDLYGDDGADYVRIAMVQPNDALQRAAQRLHAEGTRGH